MDLNITAFWNALKTDVSPRDYSASRAEIGDDAGPVTWGHAVEDSTDYLMLDDEEKREAFRDHVRGFGGWSDEEIAAWSDTELNALLIQMISGDVREVPDMDGPSNWDWDLYEKHAERGMCSGRIGRGVDPTQVFYYIGD